MHTPNENSNSNKEGKMRTSKASSNFDNNFEENIKLVNYAKQNSTSQASYFDHAKISEVPDYNIMDPSSLTNRAEVNTENLDYLNPRDSNPIDDTAYFADKRSLSSGKKINTNNVCIENDAKIATNSISNIGSPLNRQVNPTNTDELAIVKHYRSETIEVELERSFKPIDENPERDDNEMSQTSSKHKSKTIFLICIVKDKGQRDLQVIKVNKVKDKSSQNSKQGIL